MDRFACLLAFVKSVELGSISLAARDLRLSPQLAGKQLRTLEDRLGVKLINRTTRSQSLTDSGKTFYERAKTILEELADAETLVTRTRSKPRGHLRISAPITFGSHLLAPALTSYMREFPEVTVELSLSNRPVDLIDEGFDVAFRTGDLPDSRLSTRRLRQFRLVLCASPSYLRNAGRPKTPADLQNHECLIFTHTALRKEWTFRGEEGPIEVAVMGKFTTDSGEALRAAAVSGMGIMLQPEELVIEDLKAGKLEEVMPSYRPEGRQLQMIFAPDRQMTPRLRSFLDFAVARFASDLV